MTHNHDGGYASDLDLQQDLIGPKEAAAIFGVAPLTASRWGRNGQVPTVQMPNGRRMFSRAYCEAYMAKRRIEVEP